MTAMTSYAMLATWTSVHTIALVAIALLLFGGKKLPELARGVAKGVRIFRDELQGVHRDIEDSAETPPAKQDKQTPADAEKK